MISPRELDILPDSILELYEELEAQVLKEIAAKFKPWKVEKLLDMGVSPDKIRKSIAELQKQANGEIEKVFNESIQKSQSLDAVLANYLNKNLPPLNKQLLKAQLDQMKFQNSNMTNSMGFMIDGQFTPLAKTYQKASDFAYLQVANGFSDVESAKKKAVRGLAESGLVWVNYESGRRNRVETSIRRNIITTINQTASKITDDNAASLGVDKFEVSAHFGARNTGDGHVNHESWQGKVYTKKELETICGLGTVDGLCGVNCRHSYYPFIDGLSERIYNNDELDKIKDKKLTINGKVYNIYEAEQKQREIERNIRRLKRMKNVGLDVGNDLKKQYAIYRDFSSKAGLPQQSNRLWVDKAVSKAPQINPPITYNDIDINKRNTIFKSHLDSNSSASDRIKNAIKEYSTNDYIEMNRFLRNKDNVSYAGSFNELEKQGILSKANTINRYIEKLPPVKENLQLHRKVSPDAFKNLGDDISEWVGKVYHEKGFMSTSIDNKVFNHKEHRMIIRIPGGTKSGVYIENISRFINEKEFLVKSNTIFEIKEVFKDEFDKITVVMEWLNG